jgi:Bromodomain
VLKEPIDISLEGDRWTWHESECEKLLKALRHQSDVKYMTFFITPNYPHDYAAYIAKPMDWEKIQRMLKKRQYRVFGDLIDDLRLIFTNALKYNAKHKGTDNVSGRAFEAAKYMSLKLEAAINKMMITVSDRLERERIDHSNAEREIEAAERAEEAQIRAAWKKEPNNKDESASLPNTSVTASQKIRLVRRVTHQQNTDFEIPFFDEEDDGQHESSYFEFVKFQKAMFERQRQELLSMHEASKSIGLGVISRLIQHQMAKQWAEEGKEEQQAKPKADVSTQSEADDTETNLSGSHTQGSMAFEKLNSDSRTLVQVKIKSLKRNKPSSKNRSFLDLG